MRQFYMVEHNLRSVIHSYYDYDAQYVRNIMWIMWRMWRLVHVACSRRDVVALYTLASVHNICCMFVHSYMCKQRNLFPQSK